MTLDPDQRGNGREYAATDVFDQRGPGLSQHAMDDGPTVSSEFMDAEQRLALEQSMSQLAKEQRQVIELRHFDELSFAQIAEQMNRSEPATRMLWVRALRNLQRLTEREEQQT